MKERDIIHKKLTDKFDALFETTGKKWNREDKNDAKADNLETEVAAKNKDDDLTGILNELYSAKTKDEQIRKQNITNLESVRDKEIITKLAQAFKKNDGIAEAIVKIESTVKVDNSINPVPVSYTHLRAHETRHDLVCRLLLEK